MRICSIAQRYLMRIETAKTLARKSVIRAALRAHVEKCEHCTRYRQEINRPKKKDIVSDDLGSCISIYCPKCHKRTMQVVRPGKFQCTNCE